MLDIRRRRIDEHALKALCAAGIEPLRARLYAARGVQQIGEIDYRLSTILPFELLANARTMACLLADAIAQRRRLLIVADYDADGATACALGVRALRAFGAEVDYLVPNRFEYGYGLTVEIVQLAQRTKSPDIIITVDNGIASVEGVAEAARHGIDVLITDHHLPGAELPAARCIVNPNQPGCEFPSKHLAGVGVMFYVIIALRSELRQRGAFVAAAEPNLAHLLDLVALGTVADVVRLDSNNRTLVHNGLKRIREGRAQPGIRALYRATGRDPGRASTYDLGFMIGPRLNAAGRLTDMALGIECLVTDDESRADEIARELDALNRERRSIESQMQQAALAQLEAIDPADGFSVCLYDPSWHQGVIGILASRLKERFNRPAVVFAQSTDGSLKGSGRSIGGLHLRDALDLVTKREPGLIARFGGHAAAAGLTLAADGFAPFAAAFESVCRAQLTPGDLARTIESDGALVPADLTADSAALLQQEVWGQGFATPIFDGEFRVVRQRIVGNRHSRIVLDFDGTQVDAILFGNSDPLPAQLTATYRLGLDQYNGAYRVQLIIDQWQPGS
jgi:single-stranded-DNA-specific exonuclease